MAAGHGHLATCSACGQGPAGCHERGHKRLEQVFERGAAVGLAGHEGAVDGGEREPRELVGDRALWVIAERGRGLRPQEVERVLSDAARQLAAEAGVPLDAVRIGHLDGDLYDPRCVWLRHRQIASDGAILVRPDRFIAWRSPAASDEPRAVLTATLSQILA